MTNDTGASRPRLEYKLGWGSNGKKVPRKPRKPSVSVAPEVSRTKSLLSSFHILVPNVDGGVILNPTLDLNWEDYRECHWVWLGRVRQTGAIATVRRNRWGEGVVYNYPSRSMPMFGRQTAIRVLYELVNGPMLPEKKLVRSRKSQYLNDVNPYLYRIASSPFLTQVEALTEIEDLDFDAQADPFSLSVEIANRSRDPDFRAWVEQVLGAEEPEVVAEAFRLSGVPDPRS